MSKNEIFAQKTQKTHKKKDENNNWNLCCDFWIVKHTKKKEKKKTKLEIRQRLLLKIIDELKQNVN